MICPKCKSEFINGIYMCSDCDIPLVDSLPATEETVKDHFINSKFVVVYNPISSQEVSIIKMILEREGIPFHIKNDRLHGAILFGIQGPGKMELYVPEEYAKRVVELLKNELEHD
jgi:hypothetical protein